MQSGQNNEVKHTCSQEEQSFSHSQQAFELFQFYLRNQGNKDWKEKYFESFKSNNELLHETLRLYCDFDKKYILHRNEITSFIMELEKYLNKQGEYELFKTVLSMYEDANKNESFYRAISKLAQLTESDGWVQCSIRDQLFAFLKDNNKSDIRLDTLLFEFNARNNNENKSSNATIYIYNYFVNTKALRDKITDIDWYQTSAVDQFNSLINEYPTSTINQVLAEEIRNNDVVLHYAASYQSGSAFKALLEKCSADAITNALVEQGRQRWTPLQLAAHHQSESAFNELISKAHASGINEALSLQAHDGESNLFTIVRYQSSANLRTLLMKKQLNKKTLSDASMKLTNTGESLLHPLFTYHPPEISIALLARLNETALDFLIKDVKSKPRLLSHLLSNVIYESSWQRHSECIKRISQQLENELTTFSRKCKLSGKNIPTEEKQESKQDTSDEFIITTGKKHKINLKEYKDTDLELLWKEGVASAQDYYLIKRHASNQKIAHVADSLSDAMLLRSGSRLPFSNHIFEAFPDDISNIIKQGNAVFKIIKNEHHADFVKQIKDPGYRPKLRNPEKKGDTKLLLRDMKFINHKDHSSHKKDNTHFATKKQSATLLSPELMTSVFGDHHKTGSLVGILSDVTTYIEHHEKKSSDFKPKANYYYLMPDETKEEKMPLYVLRYYDGDQYHTISLNKISGLDEAIKKNDTDTIKELITDYDNKKMLKALFTEDRGTYWRGWVGNTSSVKQYADKMKNIVYTDFKLFQEAIKHTHRVNEVLTKFAKYKLKAIFIATDTTEARKIARERRAIYKQELNIDLPIVIYDKSIRHIKLYTKLEQQNDIFEGDQIAYLTLLETIRSRISDAKNMKKLTFFGILPDGIAKIDEWLNHGNEASPNFIVDKIWSVLGEKSHPYHFRTKKTQKIYNELYNLIHQFKQQLANHMAYVRGN